MRSSQSLPTKSVRWEESQKNCFAGINRNTVLPRVSSNFCKNKVATNLCRGVPCDRCVPLKYIIAGKKISPEARNSVQKVVEIDTRLQFSRQGFLEKHAPQIAIKQKKTFNGSTSLQMACLSDVATDPNISLMVNKETCYASIEQSDKDMTEPCKPRKFDFGRPLAWKETGDLKKQL